MHSDKEIIELASNADYIFAFWSKKKDPPPKYFLLDEIGRWDKTVFIDGSEWNQTGRRTLFQKLNGNIRQSEPWINEDIFSKVKLYLKRECYPSDIERGIKPFPFAALSKYFTNNDPVKDIDVFCLFGQNKTGLRQKAEKISNKLKKEGYNVIVGGSFPFHKYLDLTARSLISIDAWGGGDCNARRWEIHANKSCAFVQKYNITIPNDFTNGVNVVEFTSASELEEKLRYYLRNKDELVSIGKRGYDHLIKYHIPEKRIDYIFANLK